MTLKACTEAELVQEISGRGLPGNVNLFDLHLSPNGSCLFFLEIDGKRTTIALAPGDDRAGRFLNLLEATMAKEIGMKKSASAKAKAYDEKMDKKMGYKEGSKADLKADKAAMKKFPAKKAK